MSIHDIVQLYSNIANKLMDIIATRLLAPKLHDNTLICKPHSADQFTADDEAITCYI